MENVVATAIGRYRVRKDGAELNSKDPSQTKFMMNAPEKTLENTISPTWGWPCILVFVSQWLPLDQLRDRPDQVVPRFLYMPDGRMIPTCVIKVTKKEEALPPLANLSFPGEMMGGGYPIVTEVQGQQHIASVGCIVTDGDSIYGLTNKHVVGERVEGGAEREIFTFINGQRVKIGTADHRQVGRKPFTEIFRGWSGSRAFSTLDAGLIRIDDIRYWTAQIFGLGELGEPVDLHSETISLDLIGCPLRAFGAASGEMFGEIQALFYRYKSIGGFDYISDFLIGSMADKPNLATKPGDSGTVWCYDPELLSEENKKQLEESKEERSTRSETLRPRPIALQWGGHTMMTSGGGKIELSFALATSLSTICRELDVDIVRGLNIGLSEYWGKLGHYKIAAKACELVSDVKLKLLMKNNKQVIAFEDEVLRTGKQLKIDPKQFVPLADVPDFVWRTYRKKDAGNHFADMDEPGKGAFQGTTLLELTRHEQNISISVWNKFYDSIGTDHKRGALPFRVWQIYVEMVKFLKQRDLARFVCAAGILSHYVGDACQPLHVSYLHHGRNKAEEKVHSYYEGEMLDRKAADVIASINSELAGISAVPDVNCGKEAAISVIELMRSTVKTLPPIEVIEAYNESRSTNVAGGMMNEFFSQVGARTIKCMAQGCIRLASIWESAWHEGDGKNIPDAQLAGIPEEVLMDLYNDKEFLEAFWLKDPEFEVALQ